VWISRSRNLLGIFPTCLNWAIEFRSKILGQNFRSKFLTQKIGILFKNWNIGKYEMGGAQYAQHIDKIPCPAFKKKSTFFYFLELGGSWTTLT